MNLIREKLNEVENEESESAKSLTLSSIEIPATEIVRQALHELLEYECFDSELPRFTLSELTESRHFDKSESLSITLRFNTPRDTLQIEGVAYVLLKVQMAKISKKDVLEVSCINTPWQVLFDGC